MTEQILYYIIAILAAIIALMFIVDIVLSSKQEFIYSVTQLRPDKEYHVRFNRGLRFNQAMVIKADEDTIMFLITETKISGRQKMTFEVYNQNSVLVYRLIIRNAKSIIELKENNKNLSS